MTPKRLSIVLIWALALPVTTALAFSEGPPDGRTNAPGEGNCTACHTSFPVDSGAGMISVSGLTDVWSPETDYDLVVTVADPSASRWGFEFTILDGNGDSAGTLTSLDGNTQLSTTGTRTYAKHTSAGTQFGTPVSGSWTVRWTSPAAGIGDITFYAAGNGANSDFSPSGDNLYTTNALWTEGGLSDAGPPMVAAVRLDPNYPNPFNPRTTIAYELERGADVRLAVYGLDGSLVRVLESGFRAAGPHDVVWNGLDDGGRSVSSGVYLYRLRTGTETHLRRMSLVR